MKIASIFDDFNTWLGIGKTAIDKGEPVAETVITNAGNLFGIIKTTFQGQEPTAEQLAAAEQQRHDLAKLIAAS
jgi:hypothetical protein